MLLGCLVVAQAGSFEAHYKVTIPKGFEKAVVFTPLTLYAKMPGEQHCVLARGADPVCRVSVRHRAEFESLPAGHDALDSDSGHEQALRGNIGSITRVLSPSTPPAWHSLSPAPWLCVWQPFTLLSIGDPLKPNTREMKGFGAYSHRLVVDQGYTRFQLTVSDGTAEGVSRFVFYNDKLMKPVSQPFSLRFFLLRVLLLLVL